jgi:hypothetical protein
VGDVGNMLNYFEMSKSGWIRTDSINIEIHFFKVKNISLNQAKSSLVVICPKWIEVRLIRQSEYYINNNENSAF